MKTVLLNAVPHSRDMEGYVDPPSLRYGVTSPLEKPKHCEGSFGDHTGYYTLPEPYPVFHPATAG